MDETQEQLEYRCVCGEVLAVRSMQQGCDCPNCGRHCGASALAQALVTSAAWVVSGPQPPALPRQQGPALPEGTRLQHFRIEGALGRGGMGVVYRAIDESLERYVALKVIERQDGSSGEANLQGLLQEARSQARLNHPNVAQMFYVQHQPDSEESVPFLAMELVAGETLEARLASGPLPVAEAIDVAVQMVRALRHAFVFDLIHRDVKPGNVMFANDGTVKLTDFGLAHRIGDGGRSDNKVVGTPAYMAPEIFSGSIGDFRSDVYAVGVTLFQMVFQRLPYTPKNPSVLAVFEAHATAEIEFPEKWPAELPLGLRSLLVRLLAKEPKDRPQSYDQLLADLEALRPRQAPPAGRFVRGLAWGVDLALMMGINSVFVAPLQTGAARAWVEEFQLLRLPVLGLLLGAPALAAIGQAYWRTSIGKRLLQLRITDRHGGQPRSTVLASRMMMQAMPVLIINAGMLEGAVGMAGLANLAAILGFFVLVADVGLAIFSKRGRSIHDRLSGTYVGLDVREQTR